MTTGHRQAGSRAARFFAWLLLAYPKSFRDCFGDGMRYAFVSRMEEVGQSGRGALTLFWIYSVWHALFFGAVERVGAFVALAFPGRRPNRLLAIGNSPNPSGHGHDRVPIGIRFMRLIDRIRQDLFYAVRSLSKRPGMSLLAVLTFALGIGASSSLFGVVDSVLLRPLPYPDPEAIVSIYPTAPELRGHPTMGGAADRATFSWPEFADVREHQQVFQDVAAFSYGAGTVSGDGPPERISLGLVTYEFFSILGAIP